jgi:hypothetical protein
MKQFVLLCTALLTTGAFAQPGHIGVQGNHFVTADGKTIIFRGLDTSDSDKLQRNGEWNKIISKRSSPIAILLLYESSQFFVGLSDDGQGALIRVEHRVEPLRFAERVARQSGG